MRILRTLLEAEAEPLARAGLEAVSVPARRLAARLAWGTGLLLVALIVVAAALGLGALALAALALKALPTAIAPLAWATGGLVLLALACGIAGARLISGLDAGRIMRDGRQAYRARRRRQPPLGAATRAAQDRMMKDSYAFARGFADGWRARA